VGTILAACSLERGLLAGGVLGSVGVAGLLDFMARWHSVRFGHLSSESVLRVVLPSVTALILSCQMILGTFFLSILSIRRTRHPVVLEVSEASADMLAPAVPPEVLRSGISQASN
jgi:hypothetical protein